MSENTEALAEIIRREHARAIFRQRPEDCWDAAADAVLAAGYRKPRNVTTYAQLGTVYAGAIVRDAEGELWGIDGSSDKFFMVRDGADDTYSDSDVPLPATVLHEGDAS